MLTHVLCTCVADARGEQAVAWLDYGRHDIDLYKLAVLPRPEHCTRTCLAHLRFSLHTPTSQHIHVLVPLVRVCSEKIRLKSERNGEGSSRQSSSRAARPKPSGLPADELDATAGAGGGPCRLANAARGARARCAVWLRAPRARRKQRVPCGAFTAPLHAPTHVWRMRHELHAVCVGSV